MIVFFSVEEKLVIFGPFWGFSKKKDAKLPVFGIFLQTVKSDWAKTTSILIVPFSRSFWVVTRLVCDNFISGAENGQKWPKLASKWPNMMWLSKKWLILIYFTVLKPFWSHKVGCATFLQWGGLNGPKFWFCRREKFLMGGQAQTFSTSYMTQKLFYIAFSGNLGNMFLRKIHFCVHPFEPKKAIFDLLRGCFWPKTWKK